MFQKGFGAANLEAKMIQKFGTKAANTSHDYFGVWRSQETGHIEHGVHDEYDEGHDDTITIYAAGAMIMRSSCASDLIQLRLAQ